MMRQEKKLGYSHDGRGLKESKHLFVTQLLPSLTPLPLPHVPSFLSPPLSPSPRPTFQCAQSGCLYRWPCSSLLSQWELLAWEAFWPSAPTIIPSLYRSPKVYWRPDWMPRYTGRANQAAELHGDFMALLTTEREQNTTHMSLHTSSNKIKLPHYLWLMVCVWVWGGVENKWVHCIFKKHMHAHLHPHISQTQDWVTAEAFQLPAHSPASLYDTSLTEVGNHT